jgi:hypothetical protein
MPSMNLLDYQRSKYYIRFKNIKSNMESYNRSFTFGSFYYKKIITNGTCSDWVSYFQDSLNTPFDFVKYTQLTFTFENFDIRKQVFSNITSTCTDSTVVKSFVVSLIQGSDYQGNCNNNLWRVMNCNGNVVACLNCKKKCVNTVTCPGTSFVVNPCDTTCNSRSIATAVINVRYSLLALYPQYLNPLQVAVTSNTAVVSTNITRSGKVYCAAFRQGSSLTSVLDTRPNGNFSFSLSRGPISIPIFNLEVDTDYDVYCYTDDFGFNIMPFSEMVSSRLPSKPQVFGE